MFETVFPAQDANGSSDPRFTLTDETTLDVTD